MKSLLGGKGANLAEMASLGLSVPPGLTISTEACHEYQENGQKLPPGLWKEIMKGLQVVEDVMGACLGEPSKPLLLSVRSGAAISMPGMMDTVLNLGLNDEVVAGLALKSGDRFAYDSYRRFLDMFGDVVMGIPHSQFEEKLGALKVAKAVSLDTDLSASDLKVLVSEYKKVYLEVKGVQFPTDPEKQLHLAVIAVFDSWDSPRAVKYRNINNIKGLKGTAVNIQCMVFGNMGNTSGTGVLFTRNPSTGENKLYGEFLINAQGEDVVAGIRTPEELSTMKLRMPEVYSELVENCSILERHYKDMMDIEFTVQENRLWMLQCRAGKRTGKAAVKIAVDMVKEGLINVISSIKMVEPGHLDQLLHPQFENPSAYKDDVVATGLPASPGAAVGQVVFTSEDAETWYTQGKNVILVRTETSPEDVGGMHAASGILTARGGMTSHAAVVARGWGKCCISGCSDIHINDTKRILIVGDKVINEGDWLSLNGSTGEIIMGKLPLAPPALSRDLETFMSWVDEKRKLKVRANADTPGDAQTARNNGAEGIGLCRTEHMFFASEERIRAIRQMIMAVTPLQQQRALDLLLPYQKSDFEGIFRAMNGLPVTIRLLDPPLHEFLPKGSIEDIVSELTVQTGMSKDEVISRVEKLSEVNPMLGFRGCRLGISYPELTEMQSRAIFEAAISMSSQGVKVLPEIMVPLIGTPQELGHQVGLIHKIAEQVFCAMNAKVSYKVGTMIEVPRAALLADEIAEHAEFFSFGTNDLTQMTFGYSRDDVGKFLPIYLSKGILQNDPFEVLDTKGVGQLVKIATTKGRMARPDLKVGICGEHGGEPSSIAFFAEAGLDYVSCSPFRAQLGNYCFPCLLGDDGILAQFSLPKQARKVAEQSIRPMSEFNFYHFYSLESFVFLYPGFLGGLVPGNAFNATTLENLLSAGALGLKCFMSPSGISDFPMTNLTHIKEGLYTLAKYNKPLFVHAEVHLQTEGGDDTSIISDPRSYSTYLKARPASWEEAAIRELHEAMMETKAGGRAEGAHVHIVHLSDAKISMDLIKDAKSSGASVTVETAPHYLSFAAEEIRDGDTRFKCSPPIRDNMNRQKLWEALLEGHIDLLSSDHSPTIPSLKLLKEGDFLRAWGGISSLQFDLPATWSSGLNYNITLNQLVQWWSEKPAKLAGQEHNKGGIVTGKHADFVVWKPDVEFVIDNNYKVFLKNPSVSAYLGRRLSGKVLATYVRGNLVYSDGRHSPRPCGEMILGK